MYNLLILYYNLIRKYNNIIKEKYYDLNKNSNLFYLI